MTLRLGVTSDVDLAPLFFPIEAGWVDLPNGTKTETKSLSELEKSLLAGTLDVAPVSPLIYAANQAQLRVLPTPVRAFDLASDSIFLFSTRRLDQIDKMKIAVSPNSNTGEAILKLIASKYYGIEPETWSAPTEAATLEALQGQSQGCVISGEAAMRAAGWAKAKGYFVEDLTKAWWIMTGLPLPIYLFAVRQEWTVQESDATSQIRALMLSFRRALLSGQEQRATLLARTEARTGLPADALDNHFKAQRYELNEAHLRGLLDFYRRAAASNLIKAPGDLAFFPSLSSVAPAPAAPPRRSQPEQSRPAAAPARDRLRPVKNEESDEPETPNPKKSGSRRSEAQARGLRVIKGGKDPQANSDDEE